MSKLMWIAGILLISIGIALGLMVFVSPASVVGWGLTPEVAAILLVGGIVSLGLGGVINAVETQPRPSVESYARRADAPATAIPEFGRRMSEASAPAAAAVAPAAAAAASVANDIPEVSQPVKDTIQALEQARQKIEQAFDPKPSEVLATEIKAVVATEPEPVIESLATEETAPPPEGPEEQASEAESEPEAEAADEEEVVEDGQLYVVEERFIRARPARILSDGTVEAETDEGWMRFENLEHLDEYLDSMAPARG
jgi:hypothetical protein